MFGDGSETWRCEGDESAVCCHYRIDGATVVVTGILVEDAGATAGYRIEPSSVCAAPSR